MKARLSRILVTIAALVFLFIPPAASYAKNIYRWTDKDGTLHFTDDPTTIPEEKIGETDIIEGKEGGLGEKAEINFTKIAPAPSEEESPEEDLEAQRKEQALREVWANRALEIEAEEKAILEEIKITEQAITEKKREEDSLLINGYFADYSILELRSLNDYLKGLENQLGLVEQERVDLKEEARREGIPPGYLRP